MIEFEFSEHFDEVADALDDAVIRALETCGLAGERFAKENVTANGSVDTGRLRNSISHAVVPDEKAVYIGSNAEYAPYVELGTGKYYPGGRRTPWAYQDEKGNWHRTEGQPPKPFIKPAVADHGEEYRTIIKNALENG